MGVIVALALAALACTGEISNGIASRGRDDGANEDSDDSDVGPGAGFGGEGVTTGGGTGAGNGSGRGGGPGATGGTGGVVGPIDIPPLPPLEPIEPTEALACTPAEEAPGPRRVWRLGPVQYRNTIHAAFQGRGVIGVWTSAEPKDVQLLIPFDGVGAGGHFSNMALSFTMTDDELWRVLEASRNLAEQMMSGRGASCVGKGAENLVSCVKALVADRGPILFSRPLTAEEVDGYAGIAAQLVSSIGERGAGVLALQALFSSPRFLFREEGVTGTPDASGLVRLTPYELAAQLSYSLTDNPPDDTLWAVARDGALETPTQIRAQVERLLFQFKPKKETLPPKLRFFREYLQYEKATAVFKDPDKYPIAAPGRVVWLIEDTDAWLSHLLDNNKTGNFLTELFTSSQAFVRGDYTGPFYNLNLGREDRPTKLVDLDPKQRAGFLTQPAFLMAMSGNDDTDPVKRGAFVRESLLCGAVPKAPLDGVPPLPDLGANASHRDKLRVHASRPSCWVCHQFTDPIGLAFESYDHLGRFKTSESGGRPVDATGWLTGSGEQDGPIDGVIELSRKLRAAPVVSECLVRNTFEFWMGREHTEADQCTMFRMSEAFKKDGGDYLGMLTALFTSKSFLYRSTR